MIGMLITGAFLADANRLAANLNYRLVHSAAKIT